MSETNRVQRWRQQQREAGKDALTIWLPRELKLYLEDIALKRHCSPSDLIQQALTTCYPLSTDVTDTVTDTIVTDTPQLRLVLQQELQALLYESQHHQGAQALEGVTDTATDAVTVMSQLRTVVEEAVWESMDKWQKYQHLPVVPIVTDTDTDTVTDTATDTTTEATTAPEPPLVTDTITDTKGIPPFDTIKYRLGKLCPRSHDYHATGQSLRTNNKAGYCLACNAEDARARRQAKRQEVSA